MGRSDRNSYFSVFCFGLRAAYCFIVMSVLNVSFLVPKRVLIIFLFLMNASDEFLRRLLAAIKSTKIIQSLGKQSRFSLKFCNAVESLKMLVPLISG